MSKNRLKLIEVLMDLRKDWTIEDYTEAYADVWNKIPRTLKDCSIKMREYITLAYDTTHIKTCIENEQP